MSSKIDEAAWKLIFSTPAKYKSYKPRNLPNAPHGAIITDEPPPTYTSPYSSDKSWANTTKNKNKKYTLAVVQSEAPLTNTQHNRLINKLKNVTAV